METRGFLTRGFLRTGQAAQLLGCSRQHVVDLCDEGKLAFQSTGVHRRIRREDVEGYRYAGASEPRREDLRSLWLNRAIAGKLVRNPDRVLGLGRRNLERFRKLHARGSALRWLDEWDEIIAQGPEAVMRVLVSDTPHARDLRQNSPFPGVLSEHERQDVLGAFRRHWARRPA